MSLPALIMWVTVLFVGVPSALRNPTSAALVLSWLAGEAVVAMTGNSLPTSFYLFPDIFVIAIIMAKHEYCNQRPYRNTLHQLKCVLLERSPADRVVVLIFPLAWAIYVSPLHPFYAWYALWALTLAQFLAAGAESLFLWRAERRAKKLPPIINTHLIVSALFPHRAAERVLLVSANGGGGDG